MKNLTVAALLIFGTLFIVGCELRDVPRLSADGKHVVLLVPSRNQKPTPGNDKPQDVAIVSVKTGEQTTYQVPEGWYAEGVQWMGDKLLVSTFEETPEAVGKDAPEHDSVYWLLDPNGEPGHLFVITAFKPHIKLCPFVSLCNDAKALYAPDMDAEHTNIYALDGTTKLGRLPFEAQHIGDGWFCGIRCEKSNSGRTEDISFVEVFSPTREKMARITAEEIGKACYRDPRDPICIRISTDHQAVVMGFDTSTIFRKHPYEYTFGVFSLKTGKLLWAGNSNALHGLPVMIDGAVYALEAKDREINTRDTTISSAFSSSTEKSRPTGKIVLAEHTEKGRTVVMQLPLKEDEQATLYSASEDRKTFVLLVESNQPRLMLIPIRPDATEEDIRSVELKQ